MKSIPLLHTSQARPFIDFLARGGCPVEGLLHEARLPAALLEPVDGYISEYRLWQLLDIAAHRQGIDDLGMQVGQRIQVGDLGQLAARVSGAPSLYAGLYLFCRTVGEESSHARFWLNRDGEQLWFCRAGIKEIDVGQRHVELYTALLMIKLVRLFAGPNWRPSQLWLQTSDRRGLRDCADFEDAEIRCGQNVTAIAIPNVVDFSHADDCGVTHISRIPLASPDKDFATSLRRMLKLYLPDAYPEIELAADLARVSVRTLQRRLAETQLSYSELIQQARLELACSMLEDPAIKVTEIAYDLAYASPAHFTRAFRRWAGVSPREYRHQYVNDL